MFKKRPIILFSSVLAVLALSVGAYAYFTNAGAGTGSATVGTSVAAVITGTSTNPLYPGGPGVPVSITVKNNGSGHQFVTSVHFVSAEAFTGPLFTNPIAVLACDPLQFSMVDVPINEDLAAGATSTAHTGTLLMANTPTVSQDGCKLAIVRLNLTSS